MNENQTEKVPFMKKVFDYLSNFKKLSRIMVLLGGIGLVLSILLFVCFEISGGKTDSYFVCAFAQKGANLNVLGMIMFLVGVLALVMSAVVGYQGLPFAFPKDKLNPSKAIPWCAFVGGIAEIVSGIFSILVIVLDTTIIAWAWAALAALLILLGICNTLVIIPILKCEFWMPKLGTDNEKE